ncbi:MAG: hypothetical protein LAP13_00460 [Acidobacteriia bacterium]|nr:hypothetical protein [Terriglobia bacterium]
MRWWKNWFRNTSFTSGLALVATAFMLFVGATSGGAQETLDQRYQQAVSFFNSAKMEDACEAFKVIEKEKPGYGQTSTYLKVACGEVGRMQKMEEDDFNQGVDFYSKGRLDDAKQKFDQALKVPLKNPKLRGDVTRYLKLIADQQSASRYFDEGVRLFKQGRLAEAKARFSQVAQGNGPNASGAQNYLNRIEQAEQAAKQQPKPPGGTTTTSTEQVTQPGADEQILRTALIAYFNGNLNDAEHNLSNYLDNHGRKRDLAFFFRGATHGTRYFLSGQKDAKQRDLALADFRSAKDHGAQFQPPQKYVSPKILALYAEVAGSVSP